MNGIVEQLRLEEDLLRNSSENHCLVRVGSVPTIVMGISAKPETVIHLDKVPPEILIHRRFSGGGTVIVDENTVFVTFICNKADFSFPAYPEPILRWAESMLAPVTPGLQLQENDFVIGKKKCGGNALYIKKDRWLVHTSFLWDFDAARMSLLKFPPKTPQYRENRSHDEFLCKLCDFIPDRDAWIRELKGSLPTIFRQK